MTYPQEAVNSYKSICEQEGGILLVIKKRTYDCTMGDEEDTDVQLIIQNMAQCVASVDDCEGFPQVKLLVQTMEELGVECTFGIDNAPSEDAFRKTAKPFSIVMAVAGCLLVIALIACLVVKLAWRNNKERNDNLEMEEETGMFDESRRID
jgi:hypothetical protein